MDAKRNGWRAPLLRPLSAAPDAQGGSGSGSDGLLYTGASLPDPR